MVPFFLVLRRFLQVMVGAWRRDEEFRVLLILVVFILVVGTIFYSSVEGWSALNALYFSVTTLATVGLGDLTPHTALGKLFTVVYIFLGLGIIAGFISKLAKEPVVRTTSRRRSEDGEDDVPEGGAF